jgi:hypothetical protein
VIDSDPVPPVVVQAVPDSNTVLVTTGGTTTAVTMRRRTRPQTLPVEEHRKSPAEDSEAYGTGSSTSEAAAGADVAVIPSETGAEQRPNRHSRLFRLLQDSDYADSDATCETPTSEAGCVFEAERKVSPPSMQREAVIRR